MQGWHLNGTQRYQPLTPNERGWLWCENLGLWLGTWEGSIRREPPQDICSWLRFYDSQGNLILLPEEIAVQERQRADQAQQRADQAQQRADQLAARLRDLGEDPNAL